MNMPGICARQHVVNGVRCCGLDSLPCTVLGCPNFKDGPDMRFIPAGKEDRRKGVERSLLRHPTAHVRLNDPDRKDLYRLRWKKAWMK